MNVTSWPALVSIPPTTHPMAPAPTIPIRIGWSSPLWMMRAGAHPRPAGSISPAEDGGAGHLADGRPEELMADRCLADIYFGKSHR